MSASEDSFLGHLLELRQRLVWVVIVWVVCFFVLFPWARELYSWLASPLLAVLPANSHMITTQIVSSFTVPMKVTLMIAFVITLPHTFYQVWAFVAPGLYHHEKRLVVPLVLVAMLLFFIGMGFAYGVVAPLMFGFFSHYTTPGVTLMPDMENYLSLMLSLLIVFGLTFQVPIAVMVLVRAGIVSRQQLKEIRSYVILGAFIIGAIATPPDVMSQFLLAVPLCGLYELGIILSRWTLPPPPETEDTRTEETVPVSLKKEDAKDMMP